MSRKSRPLGPNSHLFWYVFTGFAFLCSQKNDIVQMAYQRTATQPPFASLVESPQYDVPSADGDTGIFYYPDILNYIPADASDQCEKLSPVLD